MKLQNMPGAADIVPFGVTLTFEDKATLQAFVIERLNQTRARTRRV